MAFKVSDVRPDPVLTRLAVELGTGGPYVADTIAPVASVEADVFKYAKWGREDLRKKVKTRRAIGSTANTVAFAKEWAESAVEHHALKCDIPDEIRNNDPSGDTLNARRTKVLTNQLRLGVESRIYDLLHGASKTNTAPTTKWDGTNPTIRKNILEGKEVFRLQCGMEPNVIVLPPAVKNVVFSDSAILDLIKYTDGTFLAKGSIPVIENMQVVIPGALVDAANPGAAISVAAVWAADEVYYLYVDQTAGNDLSALTALRQVRSLAAASQPFVAKSWRDPDAMTNTDWVGVEVAQKELVLADELVLRQLDVLT